MLFRLYALILLPFQWVNFFLSCVKVISIVLLFTLVALYKWGILHRVLHRFVEVELSKICNGATVTIASIDFTLFTTLSSSTVVIHDAILHTPQRNEWQWESPLIARVGRTHVTFNLSSLLVLPDWAMLLANKFCHIQGLDSNTPKKSMMNRSIQGAKQYPRLFSFFLRFRNIPVRDLYTIHMEDIQVFVEKRRNVFNFHLLDESLEIPDASKVMESLVAQPLASPTVSTSQILGGEPNHAHDNSSPIHWGQNNALQTSDSVDSSPVKKSADSTVSSTTQTANDIYNHMLGAVSNISRAVNEGKGISLALKHQKDGFVSHLKQFLIEPSTASSTSLNNTTNIGYVKTESSDSNSHILQTKSMGAIAKEGIQVIKQVGKVMEQNVLDMKQVVDNLSKPPPKKAGWDIVNYDLFRIGRITFREVRIFTKDVFTIRSSVIQSFPPEDTVSNTSKTLSSSSNLSTSKDSMHHPRIGWSKPIYLKEVIMTSFDLCPPSKFLDEDGVPALGQRIDILADMVLKRLLAEMAKTNTGLLLNNALGEVFSVFDSKRIMVSSNSKI